jgi:hypothetical protein
MRLLAVMGDLQGVHRRRGSVMLIWILSMSEAEEMTQPEGELPTRQVYFKRLPFYPALLPSSAKFIPLAGSIRIVASSTQRHSSGDHFGDAVSGFLGHGGLLYLLEITRC